MDDKTSSSLAQKRSEAFEDHRKQVWWQIFVPLGIFILLIVLLGYLVTTSTLNNAEFGTKYSSISLVWILIPVILIAFILLTIMAGLIFGVGQLLSITPGYALKSQVFIEFLVSKWIDYNNMVVTPVLRLAGWMAGFQVIRRRINIFQNLKIE
jgi:hypothetical protein